MCTWHHIELFNVRWIYAVTEVLPCRLWQGSLSPPSPLSPPPLLSSLKQGLTCKPGIRLELATQAWSFCLWLPSARVQKHLPSHPTQSLNSSTFHVQHRKTLSKHEKKCCMWMSVSSAHKCVHHGGQKRNWNWSYRWLWANMWVLDHFTKVEGTLKRRAFFPVRRFWANFTL